MLEPTGLNCIHGEIATECAECKGINVETASKEEVRGTETESTHISSEQAAEDAQPQAGKSLVTTNKNGGVLIFGEPLGATPVDLDGGQILVETDEADSAQALEEIKDVLRGDYDSGKTWNDLGGIVVIPQILRHLFNLGIVTKEQILGANQATDKQKIEISFSGRPFYDVFGGEWEKLVDDDHSFYQKKLIVMPRSEMMSNYGISGIVTIDHNGEIL